jgi:hypothetical protein
MKTTRAGTASGCVIWIIVFGIERLFSSSRHAVVYSVSPILPYGPLDRSFARTERLQSLIPTATTTTSLALPA